MRGETLHAQIQFQLSAAGGARLRHQPGEKRAAVA